MRDGDPGRRVVDLRCLAAPSELQTLTRLKNRVDPIQILSGNEGQVDVDWLAHNRAPPQLKLEFKFCGRLPGAYGTHHVRKRQLGWIGSLLGSRSAVLGSAAGVLDLAASGQGPNHQKGRAHTETAPQDLHRVFQSPSTGWQKRRRLYAR